MIPAVTKEARLSKDDMAELREFAETGRRAADFVNWFLENLRVPMKSDYYYRSEINTVIYSPTVEHHLIAAYDIDTLINIIQEYMADDINNALSFREALWTDSYRLDDVVVLDPASHELWAFDNDIFCRGNRQQALQYLDNIDSEPMTAEMVQLLVPQTFMDLHAKMLKKKVTPVMKPRWGTNRI